MSSLPHYLRLSQHLYSGSRTVLVVHKSKVVLSKSLCLLCSDLILQLRGLSDQKCKQPAMEFAEKTLRDATASARNDGKTLPSFFMTVSTYTGLGPVTPALYEEEPQSHQGRVLSPRAAADMLYVFAPVKNKLLPFAA